MDIPQLWKKIIPTPTYNAITYHFILHYFRNEENKNQVLIVTYFYTDIYCNKKLFLLVVPIHYYMFHVYMEWKLGVVCFS